jgi:prepilin-type N-terminal cleavage/methylation domain-containing protein
MITRNLSRRTSRGLRARLGDERGFSLPEMLTVIAILGVVLAAMTQLFASASTSQVNQTNRVRAQLDGRIALDQLRREIHCASSVSPNPNGTWPTRSITIVIPSSCATYRSGIASATWCTAGASAPYTLWRYPHTADLSTGSYASACSNTGSGGTPWTTNVVNTTTVTGGQVFQSYTASTGSTLASISLDVPVGQGATANQSLFEFTDNVALRNTPR